MPMKEYQRRWKEKNLAHVRSYARNYDLSRRYGITIAEYDSLLESQGGACAICGNTQTTRAPITRRLAVDHDHKTGKVRGILCQPCNRALGVLEDNIAKVVEYLESE